MSGPNRTRKPVTLNALFEDALMQIPAPSASKKNAADAAQTDGFLFSGNHHDCVPRALLLDKRLTPLERNAWQVLRLLINENGISVFPTYEQLAPWLASMPCTDRASHETVARALTMLRLTRWITLVRRKRDPVTGRIQGNLYVLHDEPLTLYEAIQLDQDYLGLINTALGHASKSLQRIGVHTLKALSEDPQLINKALPTRIQMLLQRFSAQGWVTKGYPQPEEEYESEVGRRGCLRNSAPPDSDSEARAQAAQNGPLRNPKADSTVSIKKEKNVLTETHASTDLCIPKRFRQLKPEQQSGVGAVLRTLEPALQQAVLDEWDARCSKNTVRNAAGYLFGIIQKALHGEFQPWAGHKRDAKPAGQPQAKPPRPPATSAGSPEPAQVHIDHIRKLLGRR